MEFDRLEYDNFINCGEFTKLEEHIMWYRFHRLTDEEIALSLGINKRSVQRHTKKIKRKMLVVIRTPKYKCMFCKLDNVIQYIKFIQKERYNENKY